MQNQGFGVLKKPADKLNETGGYELKVASSHDQTTTTTSCRVYFDNELLVNKKNKSDTGIQKARSYNFNVAPSPSSGDTKVPIKFSQPFNYQRDHDQTTTVNTSLHNRSSIASKMSKYNELTLLGQLDEAGGESSDNRHSTSTTLSNRLQGGSSNNSSTDEENDDDSDDDEEEHGGHGADNYIIKCKIKNETSFVDGGNGSPKSSKIKSEESIRAAASFLGNKDLKNILFLMFLYLLQGVPLGLTGSLPFIMSSRNVSYKDQGTFSFAFWPFSLKLLWAPIVDTLYIKRFGRRKSWLVPMQYLIGIFLILCSDYVHQLLEGPNAPIAHFESSQAASGQGSAGTTLPPLNNAATSSDIYMLTFIFFMFTFMAATQDIAVDGWGLTILSKENTAWASTCNSVGQTTGWFIGNVIFLVLESADFCNKYVRSKLGLPFQNYGIITIDRFMQFFGIVFLVTTTLVLFFKKENSIAAEAELRKSPNKDTSAVKYTKLSEESMGQDEQMQAAKQIRMDLKREAKNRKRHAKKAKRLQIDEENLSLGETYSLLFKIFRLPAVVKFAFILVTCRMAFATHSMSYLKLIEKGVPKENLSLLAVPLTPFEIILPILVTRFTNGPKPLNFFVKSIPFRLVMALVIVGFVYITPSFKDSSTNVYPFYFYLLCMFINALNSTASAFTSLSTVAFFTRISDKRIGGTYMTLLNTISNIGSSWPSTLSYFLVDLLTVKQCTYEPNQIISYSNSSSLNAAIAANSSAPGRNLRQRLDLIDANKCSSTVVSGECTNLGGFCTTLIDAYYLITFICIGIGVIWLLTYKRLIYRLQASPKSAWKIK